MEDGVDIVASGYKVMYMHLWKMRILSSGFHGCKSGRYVLSSYGMYERVASGKLTFMSSTNDLRVPYP